MKGVWGVVWLVVWATVSNAQNLVPNPSFERYLECPPYPGQIHLAQAWDAPNNQTTDFFHRCAPASTGASVPANLVGEQAPHSGDGYVGLRTWVPVIDGNPPYREYLTVALERPLQSGQEYALRCWISVAEASSHASDGVGFLFTAAPLPAQAIYTQVPQLRYLPGEPIEEREAWVPFTAVYLAQGGEQYLTIGNFMPDSLMLRLEKNEQPPTVYYYIDDVRLTACTIPAELDFAVDTFLCQGASLLLGGDEGGVSYQWSDGRSARARWIEQPGLLSLQTDWGCYQTTTQYTVVERDCNCTLTFSQPFGSSGILTLPFQVQLLELTLYDVLGRPVGHFDEADWQGLRDWHPSGVYFWVAKLHCGKEIRRQSGKILLVE